MPLLKILEKIPYAVLTILFASIAIGTFNSDFLFIDDTVLIVSNPHLSFSFANVASILARPLGQIFDAADGLIYYRPALNLLYMLNTTVWGVNPVGFHITNLLLHLVTTIFIYRTGLLLFDRDKGASLLAAALFCVHPVHNELIGRVAMNENLLGFLMVVSLYCYLLGRSYLSLTAFALALLTKESAVMLPFVLLFFELRKQKLKGAVVYLVPYAVMMAAYFGVRTAVVGIPDPVNFSANLMESILTVCSALAAYLRLLFVPYPLSVFYPAWQFTSPLQVDLLLTATICLLLGYALWRWKNEELLSPLLLGTVILLVPVLLKANNLILGLNRAFIAERQLYVPAILFSLLIAAFIWRRNALNSGKYAAATVMLIIPLFVYTTFVSSSVWVKDGTLKARFSQDYPDGSIAHEMRGGILFRQGDLNGALAEFKAALPLVNADALGKYERLPGNSSSGKFKSLGSFLDNYAIAAYQPEYANMHFNIGQVYLAKNDTDAAMKKFRAALVLRPRFVEARTALADIYMKKHQFLDASREYRLALNYIDALRRP